MNKLETNIPFAGFYCTGYEEALDTALAAAIESRVEEDKLTDEQAGEYGEILFRFTNWRQVHLAVAKLYADTFNALFLDWSGVNLELSFKALESPRFYNFETDRIFADGSEAAFIALRAAVDEATLRLMIRERFTSRSGFISFYPNELDEWKADVTLWDANELATLIACYLPDGWDQQVFEDTFGGSEALSAWDAAVDWPKVEELWAEYLQEETT